MYFVIAATDERTAETFAAPNYTEASDRADQLLASHAVHVRIFALDRLKETLDVLAGIPGLWPENLAKLREAMVPPTGEFRGWTRDGFEPDDFRGVLFVELVEAFSNAYCDGTIQVCSQLEGMLHHAGVSALREFRSKGLSTKRDGC